MCFCRCTFLFTKIISGWTRDANVFLHWFSAVPFTGGGFTDAAVREGLSEALMVGYRVLMVVVFFKNHFVLSLQRIHFVAHNHNLFLASSS